MFYYLNRRIRRNVLFIPQPVAKQNELKRITKKQGTEGLEIEIGIKIYDIAFD